MECALADGEDGVGEVREKRERTDGGQGSLS